MLIYFYQLSLSHTHTKKDTQRQTMDAVNSSSLVESEQVYIYTNMASAVSVYTKLQGADCRVASKLIHT